MSEKKRMISVGFIEPKLFEGDNSIYVTVIPHGGSVRAEAISLEEFDFSTIGKGSKGRKSNNYADHSKGGTPIYRNHWDFIRMLEEKNNGKIDHRMEADGLKLVELLQKVHYETGVVKTF